MWQTHKIHDRVCETHAFAESCPGFKGSRDLNANQSKSREDLPVLGYRSMCDLTSQDEVAQQTDCRKYKIDRKQEQALSVSPTRHVCTSVLSGGTVISERFDGSRRAVCIV